MQKETNVGIPTLIVRSNILKMVIWNSLSKRTQAVLCHLQDTFASNPSTILMNNWFLPKDGSSLSNMITLMKQTCICDNIAHVTTKLISTTDMVYIHC